MDKTVVILVGIPNAGKSTWSYRMNNYITTRICRDDIRSMYFMRPYYYSNHNENRVTEIFNYELNNFLEVTSQQTCILDNTHCKEKYIDQWINTLKDKADIKIKFFEISLFKAYWRNYIRYFKTGKWIPLKVIWSMYKNYNKINKSKYKQYEWI